MVIIWLSLTVCHLEITTDNPIWSMQVLLDFFSTRKKKTFFKVQNAGVASESHTCEGGWVTCLQEKKNITVFHKTSSFWQVASNVVDLSKICSQLHPVCEFNRLDHWSHGKIAHHCLLFLSNLVVNTSLSPVSLSIFSLAPDFLSDCLFVLDYAKKWTVLLSQVLLTYM